MKTSEIKAVNEKIEQLVSKTADLNNVGLDHPEIQKMLKAYKKTSDIMLEQNPFNAQFENLVKFLDDDEMFHHVIYRRMSKFIEEGLVEIEK